MHFNLKIHFWVVIVIEQYLTTTTWLYVALTYKIKTIAAFLFCFMMVICGTVMHSPHSRKFVVEIWLKPGWGLSLFRNMHILPLPACASSNVQKTNRLSECKWLCYLQ